MHIVFETPRLVLRRFTEEDAPLILLLNSDPEVVKYVHEPALETADQARDVIINTILPQYNNNLGRWAMYTKSNNEYIGWCGIKYRPEMDEMDLGYRLKQTAWGKGYATEAAQNTLAYGFGTLGLQLITARAHIENFASQKVLEKIGMNFIAEGIVDNCPVKTYTLANPLMNI